MAFDRQNPAVPRSDTKEHFPSAKHGTIEVSNPYDWLQDVSSPETRALIDAQSAALQAFLPDTDVSILGAKHKLGGILMGTYSDAFITSAPKFVGDDVFLRVLGRGKPFGVTCRWSKRDFIKEAVIRGDEVLSEPAIFHDEALTGKALISSAFSQGGKYWAYNEATSGSDWGIIRVKTVAGSETLSDEIHDSKFNTKPGASFAWMGDIGFFYQYWLQADQTKDGKRRPQLRFHRLGRPQSKDEVIYENADHPECTFRMSFSESKSVGVLEVFGLTATSKIRITEITSGSSDSLDIDFQTVCDDFSVEWEYLGQHRESSEHLFWTNAENGKVVGVTIAKPKELRTVVSSVEGQALRSAKLLTNDEILAVRSIDVQDELQIFTIKGEHSGVIDTPAKTVVDLSCEPDSGFLFVMESSFCYGPRVYTASILPQASKPAARPLKLFAQPPSALPPSTISSKRHFYHSADGTRVPLFVTAEDSLEVTAKTPVLLYIYGGFGISLIPHFRPEFVSFIRGFRGILATANIRGGSEYGRQWYEAACKENRQRLFDDIIGAAKFIRSDVTIMEKTPIILMGESMGALNSSSVMIQQPDLFSAVILNAGAFDILHRKEMGIRGRGAEDIGDPHDPVEFDYIRKWEPLHNMQPGKKYPPVLLTAGDQDDLVSMAHSLKMTAALQHAGKGVDGAGVVSLKIIENLGHGGNISALQRAAITISRWLWVMKALDVQIY